MSLVYECEACGSLTPQVYKFVAERNGFQASPLEDRWKEATDRVGTELVQTHCCEKPECLEKAKDLHQDKKVLAEARQRGMFL